MKASFDANGYYEAYNADTGELIAVSKNKLLPSFWKYFTGFIIKSNHTGNRYVGGRVVDTVDIDAMPQRIDITNQINLSITQSGDNFASTHSIAFSEISNRNALSKLGLKPTEVVEHYHHFSIITRHAYILPKKNLGNITGIALYCGSNQWNTEKISVSHIKDELGIKGTIPHTENNNTYIVYRLEYRIKKPITGFHLKTPIEETQWYKQFNFTHGFIPLMLQTAEHNIASFQDSYMLTTDVEIYVYPNEADVDYKTIKFEHVYELVEENGKIVEHDYIGADTERGIRTYQYFNSERAFPLISGFYKTKQSDNTQSFKCIVSANRIKYNQFYTLSELNENPIKYAKILNNEPYKIQIKYGAFVSDYITVTTSGIGRTLFELDIDLTINGNEQYD